MMQDLPHVDNEELFNRREAIDALGISQGTFSKYFAENGKYRNGYRGFYLNHVVDKLNTGKLIIDRAPYKKRTLVKPDIHEVSDLDLSGDIDDIKYIRAHRPELDGESDYDDYVYDVGFESNNVLVNPSLNGSTYYQYILPLFHLWSHQRVQPNVIYMGSFSSLYTDCFNDFYLDVPTSLIYSAISCGYDVFDGFPNKDYRSIAFGDLSSLYDPLDKKPFLQFSPINNWTVNRFEGNHIFNSANDIIQGLDMVLDMDLHCDSARRTKLIIDDSERDLLSDNKFECYLSTLYQRDYGFKLDLTIIESPEEELGWMAERDHDNYPFVVIDNAGSLPVDANSMRMMSNH